MFKELAPLVRQRAVLFTVTYVDDDQFRVNVIPKKIAEGENDALTTPVSITGTAVDLDRELPQTLLRFVSNHLELKNTLDRAKAEMEEASKAARAEARKKSGSQVSTRKEDAAISNKPATASEPSAPAKSEAPKPASLFDTPPEPELENAGDAPASHETRPRVADSQDDEDEEILREAFADGEAEEGNEAA